MRNQCRVGKALLRITNYALRISSAITLAPTERNPRMAEQIRTGIVGGGWPGKAHAKGYEGAGGFKVTAVADLIPARRKQVMDEFKVTKEFADAHELVEDPEIDAISI